MKTSPNCARPSSARAWITLALLALIGASCGGDEEEASGKSAPPPTTVVVAVIEARTVPVMRDFVARTEAVETVEVQARVEAVLAEMTFEEGKPVTKDQVLYRLDDRTFVAQLAAAEARLGQAQANVKLAAEQVSVRAAESELVSAQAKLKKAQQDVARLRPLAERDAVPRQDLDTALAAEEVAEAEVQGRAATLKNATIQEEVGILLADADLKGAEAELELAKLDVEYCTIRSPLDGLIGRTQVNVGNLVGRGDETELVTVSSIDPIYVTFAISEAEYIWMEDRRRAEGNDGASEPVHLILADDSVYEHEGRIVSADRALDQETGTLQVVSAFPNPEGSLRPGQFGRARLKVHEVEEAALVPQRAVMEQQGAKLVFVVDAENKVVQRSLQVSERFEGSFVVLEGLEAGERVIVEGQIKVRPGSTVAPTDRPITSESGESTGTGEGE